MSKPYADREIWFLTGSQGLYGEDTLRQVAEQSQEIARVLGAELPATLVWKPVLTTSDAIRRTALEANADDSVIGVIAWMHTFSPAKMWISGLDALRKPLLHLHTQANVDLPWSSIDMDFMNLNQAAHGDREFAHVAARLGVPRKTVAGHAGDPELVRRVDGWIRAVTDGSVAWPDTVLRLIPSRLRMKPNSRSPWAAWLRFMKSMSISDHGSSTFTCVWRWRRGVRSERSPLIQAFAGENVCIQAITPTQRSEASASRHT